MHLLPHREQRDAHARGDEKYRGDEPEPVGDRVGDNRGADEGDDHLDGHEAAGFPSWDECGRRTAAGPGEGCSQARGRVCVRSGSGLRPAGPGPVSRPRAPYRRFLQRPWGYSIRVCDLCSHPARSAGADQAQVDSAEPRGGPLEGRQR